MAHWSVTRLEQCIRIVKIGHDGRKKKTTRRRGWATGSGAQGRGHECPTAHIIRICIARHFKPIHNRRNIDRQDYKKKNNNNNGSHADVCYV